jgi:hypothetical protein
MANTLRIVVVVTVVAACNPQHGLPASGRARLEYVSASEFVAVFNLDNQSALTLKIEGSGNSRTGVDLHVGEYSMSCVKGDGKSDEDPPGFRHPPRFTEIQPGERARLRVHTDLTHRYRGGHCQLSLALFNGPSDTLESNEFVP